jgi:hypothetical protein
MVKGVGLVVAPNISIYSSSFKAIETGKKYVKPSV